MSRSRSPRSKRARARLALVLCGVWIAGFELMPWMHVAMHGHLAPHHHDETGAVVLDTRPAPVDDDVDSQVDEHGAPIAARHEDDGDLDAEVDEHGAPVDASTKVTTKITIDARARLAIALAHGEHSLAHHGIAVPVPAPVMTTPLPIDRRPLSIAAIVAATPCSAATPTAAARGPPARAFTV